MTKPELKPCPFCGDVPDLNKPNSYYTRTGTKWGGILCCIEGPDVRTGYEPWPAWRDSAIEAWNSPYSRKLRE